jgi:Domain of unknown function (DUF4167)
MRPGQQNRRSRGRNNGSNSSNNNNNNNQRRNQNPLARTYESSGPDVKIRGNAQHIAEKYAQLARDSLSSGDRVMAENYLQHAEHYNRIIAAAMVQQAQQSEQQRRDWDDDGDDEGDDENSDGQQGNDQNAELMSAPASQGFYDQNAGMQNGNGQNAHSNGNRANGNGGGQKGEQRPQREPREPRENNGNHRNAQHNAARRQAPVITDAQPEIEGVPAEFAHSEVAGLARTLGLAKDPAKAKPTPRADEPAEGEDGVRRNRTRRPRRAAEAASDDTFVAPVEQPADEPAGAE